MLNQHGLDINYFTKKMQILIRDMANYTPDELNQELNNMKSALPQKEQDGEHLLIPKDSIVSDFSGVPEKHSEYMQDLGGYEFVKLVNINNYCTDDSNRNGDICLAWSELNHPNVLNDAWENKTEYRILVVKK